MKLSGWARGSSDRLFSVRATRRLGAALARAAEQGRWGAVHLAVAASDLLGPEKLERLLQLEEPPGAEPVPGGQPSTLAGYLAEVLRPFPETRRLQLLIDVWNRMCRHLDESVTGPPRRLGYTLPHVNRAS